MVPSTFKHVLPYQLVYSRQSSADTLIGQPRHPSLRPGDLSWFQTANWNQASPLPLRVKNHHLTPTTVASKSSHLPLGLSVECLWSSPVRVDLEGRVFKNAGYPHRLFLKVLRILAKDVSGHSFYGSVDLTQQASIPISP